jgi:hypothetical protein
MSERLRERRWLGANAGSERSEELAMSERLRERRWLGANAGSERSEELA